MAVESLNHPLHRLIVSDPDKVQGLGTSWRAGTPLHPDIRVVSLSVVSLPHSEAAGLVVHRTQTNNCFTQPHLSHSLTAADQGKVTTLLHYSRHVSNNVSAVTVAELTVLKVNCKFRTVSR